MVWRRSMNKIYKLSRLYLGTFTALWDVQYAITWEIFLPFLSKQVRKTLTIYGEMISIAPHPVRPPGRMKSEIAVFNHPPGRTGSDFNRPLLWWLTGLRFWQWSPTVKVDKTYRCCHHFYSRWRNFYSRWWNLQALSCVYLCKFHHRL